MTEFPALRDALVRAGKRRRRRRLAFGAAFPAVAVGAAAIALITLPRSSPENERVAQPPRDQLEQSFALFRRARTAADKLPTGLGVTGTEDRSRSRSLGRVGNARYYAVPTVVRGAPWLCVLAVLPPHAGGGSACGQLAKMLRGEIAPATVVDGQFAFLFADGTRDVRVTLADGTRVAPPVRANAAIGTATSKIAITSWTGSDGARRIVADEFSALRLPRGCPRLEPLPADAPQAARRAALLAVDRLYNGVIEADVTAVTRGGGTCDPGRTLTVALHLTPTTNRESASLSQGRLLVGMVDGHLQVYDVMH